MDKSKQYDFSNTRCFIDFDATIANSLPKYNIALDILVRGKLTDKHYIEYYKDFGDAYEIIPGSPWRSILMNLVEYLSQQREIGPYNLESIRWYDAKKMIDVGKCDALMLVTFDAQPVGNLPDIPVVYYDSESSSYAVILEEMSDADISEAVKHMPNGDENVLVVEDKTAVKEVDGIDKIVDFEDIADVLEEKFNSECVNIFPSLSYEELAIDPVIRFCRAYKEAGGTLIIHSGTNEIVLLAMLDVLGIEELFDDHLNSDMMKDADPDKLGDWGYKTELLNRLLDKYPDKNKRNVVVGDTKGDAYGAYEVGMPFLLVWRGYPKDPNKLKGSDNDYIIPNDVVSVKQEDLDTKPAEDFDDVVEQMLEFMDRVSKGEVTELQRMFT